jgi:molybdenum cofactor biosynthesis enzyme MoaA
MFDFQKSAVQHLVLGIYKGIAHSRLPAAMLSRTASIIPDRPPLLRYKNALRTLHTISTRPTICASNPVRVRIAPTSHCNYQCLFCEIHRDNTLFPNRVRNTLTLGDIRKYEHVIATAYTLSFYGSATEPLLNPHLGEIITYVKSTYHTRMLSITNGSTLGRRLVDVMIEHGFDDILVSYHAGTEEQYRHLTSQSNTHVDRNIAYLKQRKHELGARKPHLHFNFALQKLNADAYQNIMDKAKSGGARSLLLTRYYNGPNKLPADGICFDRDIEAGNEILRQSHEYASRIRLKIHPRTPEFWRESERTFTWNSEDYDRERICLAPWLDLHFHPVFNERHCHHVGVCDRIELFKISYDTADLNSRESFSGLWNHPLLQYLRGTVNGKDINPLCKLCKNNNVTALRNLRLDDYQAETNKATSAFFQRFHASASYDPIPGIEVLGLPLKADG